jgi:uncharacterized protein affecting Mg2+/Co2+ transport
VGGDPLTGLLLTDDKLTVPGATIGALAPQQSVTLTAAAVLTSTTVNVATVRGEDALGLEVSDSDDARVEVFNPAISITKSASAATVLAGTPVTYTFLVTNTGDIGLFNVLVTDNVLGTIGTIGALAPGASATLSAVAAITTDVTNIGTVTGWYGTPQSAFYGSVTASDPATVDVINPGIDVVKSASASTVLPGTSVTYTFTVTNTGDVTLFGVTVVDDKLGIIATIPELPAGAVRTFTAAAVLNVTTTNVVVASGTDALGNRFSDSAAVTVAVIGPSVRIVKTASPAVILSGATVTYTYVVTNTGNVGLTSLVVTDDKLGSIGTIPALAPGASVSLEMSSAISVDTANVGTVVGSFAVPNGPAGTVSDSDDAFVDVIAPALSVTKSVDPSEILAGESVTYTFVVTNTGDVVLTDVVLTDDKLGVVGTIASLAPGASATFTNTVVLEESTTNVVVATARDPLGNEVTDTDDAFVDVALPFTPGPPDLEIDKRAGTTRVSAGDLVTYRLTYRNVGDDAAYDFTIVDDFDERYMRIVDAGGGVVSDGRITWTFEGPFSPDDGPETITYTARVVTDLPESVTHIDNVVVISAPDDENPDNDRDTWRVIIEEPFLPFTGGDWTLIALVALAAVALGVLFRRLGRTTA